MDVSLPEPGALFHRLGHAEVGDQRVAAGEEDVVGLDVAVDDALLVRHGQGVGHVADDADRLWDGSSPSRASLARSDSPSMNGMM